MKKILISCLVVVALVFGVDWIQKSTAPKQTQVYSLSDYAYTELEEKIIYKVEDLIVVDSFAQNKHTVNGKVTNTTDYYLVIFRDKNDCLVAAALSVDDDDSIYFPISRYAADDSQSIGDYVVNGYVKTQKNANTKLTQYYEEAIDKYGPVLGENMFSSQWILEYHCDALEDPLK